VKTTSGAAVDQILRIIYDGARLPLFHAKDGRAYFAPAHDARDREAVRTALQMLTQVVIRMADKWFAARRLGGWVNLEVLWEANRETYRNCNFVCSDRPIVSLRQDAAPDVIREGYAFAAHLQVTFQEQKDQHLFGELSMIHLSGRATLSTLYVEKCGETLIGKSLKSVLDLSGFDQFQLLFFLRGNNASTPKYLFAR
jgi:hypothetical protein